MENVEWKTLNGKRWMENVGQKTLDGISLDGISLDGVALDGKLRINPLEDENAGGG